MSFPLGPYHPALAEPISLRLALRGEQVVGVEVHTGYVHRGVESLALERPLMETLDLIERIDGSSGHSNRLAMCRALETAAGVQPPERAIAMRTIFAEIERALACLWVLQQVARAGEFGALFTAAIEAREVLFEGCAAATGTRIFWGIPLPGGSIHVADPQALSDTIAETSDYLPALAKALDAKGVVARRTVGLGKVSGETVAQLGLTGLLAGATGDEDDLRVSAPYEAYGELESILTESTSRQPAGDTLSRLQLALDKLQTSLQCITKLLEDLPEGQERVAFPDMLAPGEVTMAIEGPHGRDSVTLQLGGAAGRKSPLSAPGWLSMLQLRTSSSTNSSIIPIGLNRVDLRDVPLVLASFDISVASIDL